VGVVAKPGFFHKAAIERQGEIFEAVVFHVEIDEGTGGDGFPKERPQPLPGHGNRVVKGAGIHLGIHGRHLDRDIDLGRVPPVQVAGAFAQCRPVLLCLMQNLKKSQIAL